MFAFCPLLVFRNIGEKFELCLLITNR